MEAGSEGYEHEGPEIQKLEYNGFLALQRLVADRSEDVEWTVVADGNRTVIYKVGLRSLANSSKRGLEMRAIWVRSGA